MDPVVIWLIIALVLIAAEVLSGEFVLLMLGGGALVAAGVSLLVGAPIAWILAFAVASGLLVFAVRPTLKRKLARGVEDSRMHHRALEGREAVVVARVDGTGGRVKIGGEVWSAQPVHEDDVIEAGAPVLVVRISGATAVVVAQE